MNMNIIPKMNKSLFLALLLPLLFCVSCNENPNMKKFFYPENDSADVRNDYLVFDFDGELANDSTLSQGYVFCRQQQLKDDIYYAVFPEANYVGLLDGELKISLFQHQQYKPSGIDASARPMVALDRIRDQKFSNVCGALVVSLKGHEMVTALRFADNDTLDRLWGNFVVRYVGREDQYLLALLSSEGNNEVWLDCPDGVTLSDDTATTFTIMLPEGAFYRGFSMDVFCGDSLLHHVATDNDCSIKRGFVLKMPEIAIP